MTDHLLGSVRRAFPVVNILSLQNDNDGVITYGLYDRYIYDIKKIGGIDPVNATALEFAAVCHTIPALAQSTGPAGANGTFAFHVHDSLEDILLLPGTLLCAIQYH